MSLFKYVDDMALVAHIKDANSLSAYHQQVDTLMSCIKESSLELNISKTKELCCAGRRAPDLTHPLFEPMTLQGQAVEQVEAFKYLGIMVDNLLSFSQHSDSVRRHNNACSC